ncbi:hypothetical protein E0H89_11275 [Acinetobacter sp. ANC 3781]|uniref:hypothetical protein n=1 Tax=Acinetobacter sp. ANC 3781 TaxID=2529835 RepID=UPI00103AE182|nr:hypothetical protein [Acinetobacter sp. ANC 3781]TCB75518.1 hypothetical protein E0H89_11275 [Acinetobacter sp. ANC 3781]
MKPVSRRVKHSSSLFQNLITGPVVAKITGSVNKLGQQYQNATVVLYNKANLQPIAVKRPDRNGNYSFLGLNTKLKTFIVAFDQNQQFNAVIQDNMVPK